MSPIPTLYTAHFLSLYASVCMCVSALGATERDPQLLLMRRAAIGPVISLASSASFSLSVAPTVQRPDAHQCSFQEIMMIKNNDVWLMEQSAVQKDAGLYKIKLSNSFDSTASIFSVLISHLEAEENK